MAIADAFAMVKVGKSEWLFSKWTPSVRMAHSAGVSCGLTDPWRRPSATKIRTFRRGGAGSWPSADSSAAVEHVITASDPGKRRVMPRHPTAIFGETLTLAGSP